MMGTDVNTSGRTTVRSWPRIVGHRGAARLAPENTLAGLKAAAAAGARMVEFDAKLSADGVAMVMHDDTLDRTTNGVGRFADMTLARLRKLDAGGRFSDAFAGEKIPTLAEMLVTCLSLGLDVNIEIKPCPGRDEETTRTVLETAASVWPRDRFPPLVSSFQTPCLMLAATCLPDWPRGYLMDKAAPDWMDFAGRIGATTVNVSDSMIGAPSDVTRYGAGGRPVMVYTINDVDRAGALFHMGVTSIITDAPDRLSASV